MAWRDDCAAYISAVVSEVAALASLTGFRCIGLACAQV